MPEIIRYAYEFDPTGRHPANLIRNERHTITDTNRTQQNIIVPAFSPFFENSLIVTDIGTGNRLIEGVDYTIEWPVTEAATKTEGYVPLYGCIQFIDLRITGQFEIQYQTVGGSYALDGIAIAQSLANHAADPATVVYSQIVGKPLTFPPLEHVHHVNDFVGMEEVVAQLKLLIEAIQVLAREDRDSHPGYDTLIDSYFRLIDDIANLRIIVNDNKTELANAIAKLRSDTNLAITNLTNQINQDLATERQARETQDNLLAERITQANNAFENFVTNVYNVFTDKTDKAIKKLRKDHDQLREDYDAFKIATNTALDEHARQIEASRPRWNQNIENQPTHRQLNASDQHHNYVTMGPPATAVNDAGFGVMTNAWDENESFKATWEIDKDNGLHKFTRKDYTRNGSTGKAYTQYLPGRSGTLINSAGTEFSALGTYSSQRTSGAPIFVNYEEKESDKKFTLNGNQGYQPIIKARLSNAPDTSDRSTMQSTVSLGWSNEGSRVNTRGQDEGIVLHYIQDGVTYDNANTREHNAWKFKPSNGGFESGYGDYKLFKDPATNNVFLTRGDTSKGLKIDNDGYLHSVKDGRLYGSNNAYTVVNEASTPNTNAGLRANVRLNDGTPITGSVELDRDTANWSFYRAAFTDSRGVNHPAIRTGLPTRSGNVLTDEGTYWRNMGSWDAALESKAPYFIQYPDAISNDIYDALKHGNFMPMIKGRFNTDINNVKHKMAVSFGIYNDTNNEPRALINVNKQGPSGPVSSYQVYVPKKTGTMILDADLPNLKTQSYQISQVEGANYGGIEIQRNNHPTLGSYLARLESVPDRKFKFWTSGPNGESSVTLPFLGGNTHGEALIDKAEQINTGKKTFVGPSLALRDASNANLTSTLLHNSNGTVFQNNSANKYVELHNNLDYIWTNYNKWFIGAGGTLFEHTNDWTQWVSHDHVIRFNGDELQYSSNKFRISDGNGSGTIAYRAAAYGGALYLGPYNYNKNEDANTSGNCIYIRADGWTDIRSENGITFKNDGNVWIRKGTASRGGSNVGVLEVNLLSIEDMVMRSDKRVKENIEPIKNALDTVAELTGCTFRFKQSKIETAGLIAQEVEEVLPNLVSNTSDSKGLKSLNYVALIGYLVEAIKEEKGKREEVESRLALLEMKFDQLLNK